MMNDNSMVPERCAEGLCAAPAGASACGSIIEHQARLISDMRKDVLEWQHSARAAISVAKTLAGQLNVREQFLDLYADAIVTEAFADPLLQQTDLLKGTLEYRVQTGTAQVVES